MSWVGLGSCCEVGFGLDYRSPERRKKKEEDEDEGGKKKKKQKRKENPCVFRSQRTECQRQCESPKGLARSWRAAMEEEQEKRS
jgi:hypothetical protein